MCTFTYEPPSLINIKSIYIKGGIMGYMSSADRESKRILTVNLMEGI
jgi:hypothetical protein